MMFQACHLQESKNTDDLIDKRLGSQADREEVERTVKVALLCTNASPSVRPSMSEVVQMLEGNMSIPDGVPAETSNSSDVRFKAIKDFHREKRNQSSSGSHSSHKSTVEPGFSSYTSEFYEITRDSV